MIFIKTFDRHALFYLEISIRRIRKSKQNSYNKEVQIKNLLNDFYLIKQIEQINYTRQIATQDIIFFKNFRNHGAILPVDIANSLAKTLDCRIQSLDHFSSNISVDIVNAINEINIEYKTDRKDLSTNNKIYVMAPKEYFYEKKNTYKYSPILILYKIDDLQHPDTSYYKAYNSKAFVPRTHFIKTISMNIIKSAITLIYKLIRYPFRKNSLKVDFSIENDNHINLYDH